ncbi:MAG: amino acid racemase [Patescibacteria group bacterium]
MKKTIGILGGMGPEASAYFYNLIIDLAHNKYGAVQDNEFPPIIIYNLPLEGFDERGIVEAEAVKRQLVSGVKRLESAKCDFVVIACNTVHIYQDEMQAGLNIPILSIVDETVQMAKTGGYTRAGLLTSASSAKYNLYTDKLVKAGIEPLVVTVAEQAKLDGIILKVMAGKNDGADTQLIQEIVASLVQAGAEVIILGCTELPLALGAMALAVPLINSNQVIVDKALALALENKT